MNALSNIEVEGGYRRLCAGMLAQAAFATTAGQRLPSRRPKRMEYRMELRRQAEASRAWIEGNDAVLPLSEACEVLGLDEEIVRSSLRKRQDGELLKS
jgi:hypothetical protein